jgi:tetratricopeptide (TPR) repeat protein
MNSATHAPWLKSSETDEISSLPGAVVTLKKSFGYARQWNFRSSTGFTALGVSPCNDGSSSYPASEINGVLFQIPTSMTPGFDRREVGYKKVSIPFEHVQFQYDIAVSSSSNTATPKNPQTKFDLTTKDRLWLYVPLPTHTTDADENHPLLQSYVDTVLQGCLEWGGEVMAEQFLVTTGGWSTYFLNDTPSSRRPWLFRKEYNTIDRLLKKYSERTHYGDRRHPEEFASAFHRRMKGTWSIPRRNPNFTGRDTELEQLYRRLSAQDGSRQKVVAKLEVAGMGGVGKTQLVTEYCYRHFPSQYGLVAWFNAESIDSLVADYRQLLADMAAEGDSNPSEDTDEVIGEVRTRLFRSQVPWLLIFDNLEDRQLLSRFVPRGAGMRGHMLVTTRLVDTMELYDEAQGPVILGCFSPEESLELLRRAAGTHNMDGDAGTFAAGQICQRLGHLPLALGMAAAYMRRCDVNCSDYLDRYVASEKTGQSLLRHGKLNDYSLSVASSLSLSLGAIEKENATAGDVLRLLCFLGPDQISKPLLRQLLASKAKVDQEDAEPANISVLDPLKTPQAIASICTAIGGSLVLASTAGRRQWLGLSLIAACALAIASRPDLFNNHSSTQQEDENYELRRSSSIILCFSAFEYEQSDLVWDILKSFSLLSVKDGKGIIHRLLSQAMRATQSEEHVRQNLRICVYTMCSIWSFQAELPETWKESICVLEHMKYLVSNVADLEEPLGRKQILQVAQLSIEAGVLSSMALNAFVEAQSSLELALKLLKDSRLSSTPPFRKLQAQAHYELGKVHRYHGKYEASERALTTALQIYTSSRQKEHDWIRGEAHTLHELGVLEVKKHNLDSAALFLQKALDMQRAPVHPLKSDSNNADCAATLHQLASVHVARRPPALTKAMTLLQEALGLSRQIGQRAATLKQLARVAIRKGDLSMAEAYLEQALELYVELYGESKMHINIAAVKFQQGALAMQRGRHEDAQLHFSECLRIRRHVYSYARPVGSSTKDVDPSHLEVSCVLHELGRVAFAQKRYPQAMEILASEKAILERLVETTAQMERLYQARLTNLTWTRKCAKAGGDEEVASRLAAEKTELKRQEKTRKMHTAQSDSGALPLLQKAMHCRLLARQFALENEEGILKDLDRSLVSLQEEIGRTPSSQMERAISDFCTALGQWTNKPRDARKVPILSACDELRYDCVHTRL